MPKNEADLGVIAEQLAEQNAILRDMLAVDQSTNQTAKEEAKGWYSRWRDEDDRQRAEKSFRKARNEEFGMQRRTNALMRGDIGTAIFGVGSRVLGFVGIIGLFAKLATSWSSLINPAEYGETEKNLRTLLGKGAIFSNGLVIMANFIRGMGNLFMKVNTLFGASGFLASNKLFQAIALNFRRFDRFLDRFTIFSFSGVGSIIASVARFLRYILIIDGVLQSTFAGFRAFQAAEGPFINRLMEGLMAFTAKAIEYIIQVVIWSIEDVWNLSKWLAKNGAKLVQDMWASFVRHISDTNVPILKEIVFALDYIFSELHRVLTPVAEWFKVNVLPAVQHAFHVAGNVFLWLRDFFTINAAWFQETGRAIVDGTIGYFQNLFSTAQSIGQGLNGLMTSLSDWMFDLWLGFEDRHPKTAAAIREGWERVTNGINDMIQSILGWLREKLEKIGLELPEWNPFTEDRPEGYDETVAMKAAEKRREIEELRRSRDAAKMEDTLSGLKTEVSMLRREPTQVSTVVAPDNSTTNNVNSNTNVYGADVTGKTTDDWQNDAVKALALFG